MKKGRILILVGAFIVTSTLYAQDYSFKVLANKGASEVKSGDSWQAVKTGASLKAGDELKVAENSYLGLVHSSGKPIELKQAGNYKVAELAAKVSTGTSVLNKYTDFILSSNSAEAKKNRISATGAVHRGSTDDIKLFLPDNQYTAVFNNVVIINWESAKNNGPYVVTFKDMYDEEITKVETSENIVQIDINDPKFAAQSAFQVEVTSKEDKKSKSGQHVIKRMLPADQEAVKKSLTEVTGEMSEETSLNKFILAGFFEKNKLFIDAVTAYEQAIKMSPDVPSYKEAYEEFLFRNKLKEQK